MIALKVFNHNDFLDKDPLMNLEHKVLIEKELNMMVRFINQ
jgi:hypothetical protein